MGTKSNSTSVSEGFQLLHRTISKEVFTPAGKRSVGQYLFPLVSVASVVALLLLYTWDLERVPPYLNQDEAGYGLATYLIATTGRDYFGNLLPVYVEYLDNHQLGGAVNIYLAVPLVKAIGLSVITIRASMVMVGLASLAGFGVLAWKLTRHRWISLLAVWILGTTPLFLMQSRLFHDGLMPVPFIIGWLICAVEYERRRTSTLLIASAAILGVGFYSYGTARMIMPIYLGLTLLLALLSKTCSWRTCAAVSATFGITMVPGLLFALQDPELYLARFRGLSWLQEDMSFQAAGALYLHHYLASIDLADLFTTGDGSFIHSTGRAGVYLRATLPLAVSGIGCLIWNAVTKRSPWHFLVPLAFLLFPVPLALIAEVHSPSRAVYAIPLYVILCVIGARAIAAAGSSSRAGSVALALVALMVTVEAGVFLSDYFGPYRERAAGQAEINGNKPEAFRVLMAESGDPQVYYDVESVATTTYARFFKEQYGYAGAVLPAPPEWSDRLPAGARVLTVRPEAYGSGFETLSVIADLAKDRPLHTIIRKASSR